ncbi:glycosyltransferase family 4 protein [Roseisolibacter sp. H3M3-2]|uniref:glycosyltransferase family 4 protein n=1 Tax=Roseisolibacter sp. H3M3-2 TaxID=3031323 RepID=UPI0023DC9853|nr:glycosyltransferase family 4 protein [Roseisolibacter sp. H3M3-2]MDF1503033.1 glycosyltransferase family 4 protein [Roseisolibacter sp. H3M3-2]
MLLCAEMLRRGHEVTLWTSAYDHIRKQWREEWLESGGEPVRREDGLQIRFLKGCGYRTNVGMRRFVDHWLAARDFARVAPTLARPDVIVASLPDHLTAEAAVEYGRRAGAASIVDVRDKWPDVFVDRAGPGARGAVADAVLRPEHRRSARLLRRTDAVLGSMNSMLDWALTKAGRAPTWRDRVFYLTTFPRNFDLGADAPRPAGAVAAALAASAGRTVFSFVGTFNRTQHPLLILDAVDELVARGADTSRLSVIIAGDGLDAEQVRSRAAAHAFVHVVGWVDAAQMAALLAGSHVGILAMNFPSPAFNNKAFAYLASGLPILNGATGDLADLVVEHGIGVNVPGGDAGALADAIDRLGHDRGTVEAMTDRARRLFAERFDRDANYQAYAEHVEAVAADRGASGVTRRAG